MSKQGRYKDRPAKLEKFQQKQRDGSNKVSVEEEIGKGDVPGWITGTSSFTEEDNPDRL